jgi:preprotein translocase SecE subunit
MGKTETRDRADLERGVDDRPEDRPPRPPSGAAPAAAAAGGVPSGGVLELYKPGQGAYVRWCSAIGLGVVALAFASFVLDQLARFEFAESLVVRYLIPVGIVVASGIGIFHLLGRNRRVVDFMIATESEMRKVNWSTRREVLGATRVVIVTVLALGIVLFVVDVLFMFFFEWIGVLRIGMLSQIFGGGGEG